MKTLKTTLLLLSVLFIAMNFQSCKDECEDVLCQNGGTCIDGTCNCPDGFSGANCEIKDSCLGITCQNGGTCADGTCNCPDGFSGPNCEIEGFNLIGDFTASQNVASFNAGERIIFTASFTKNVNWTIQITGTKSGAIKRIEGFGQEINGNNAIWQGETTELPFFRAEMCTVELLVPEEPTFSASLMVEVLTPKIYEGTLFTDFETDLGDNGTLGNFEFELTAQTGVQNGLDAVEGDQYYLLEGIDDVVVNFFVGLLDIKAAITGDTYLSLPTTDPRDLYFNCFIKGDGSPHGIAVIQFIVDSNDSGAFEEGIDQTFKIPSDFPVEWDGWKHIHHPMSDINISEADLQKIIAIRLILVSDMNSQPNPPLKVGFGVDFLTFTQGGPLEL